MVQGKSRMVSKAIKKAEGLRTIGKDLRDGMDDFIEYARKEVMRLRAEAEASARVAVKRGRNEPPPPPSALQTSNSTTSLRRRRCARCTQGPCTRPGRTIAREA